MAREDDRVISPLLNHLQRKKKMKRYFWPLLSALVFFSCHFLFSVQSQSTASQDSFLGENDSELFRQGEKLRHEGNYDQSIKFFQTALSLAQENDDRKSEIECLIHLGILYWNIGQLPESLNFLKKALALSEKTKWVEKKDEILIYIQIHEFYKAGKDCSERGEYQKSIQNFEKAITLAREAKSKEHEVKCLRLLSLTYLESQDIDNFFSLNKKALEIARKIKHKKEEGRCSYNIGLYFNAVDNYSQALHYYEEALKIARMTKDVGDESECLTNIGDVYISVGNYEKALDFLKQVLRIDQQQKFDSDSYVAIDLNNIGVTYQKKWLLSNEKDDLNNALARFEESFRIAKKIKDAKLEIQASNNLGMVYKDLENYPEALKYFHLSLEDAKKSLEIKETANILVNIASVYFKQNDYDRCIEYCRKAIEKALEIKGEKTLWEAYLEMANAAMKKGDYQRSLELYKNSINFIESIRTKIQWEELKASYLGTYKRLEAYQNIIDLLYKLDQSEPEKFYGIEAFNFSERAKARAFLDRLEVSQVKLPQGGDNELLNQEENALMKEISSLNSRLFKPGLSPEEKEEINHRLEQCEEQLESLKRKIRMLSPDINPQIISIEQTQEQIVDDKTAFLEYCLGKESSYAFVITKRNFKIFPLPALDKMRIQVKDYLSAVTDKENQDFHLGYELFRDLVLPGLENKVNKLVFVPDDILHFLPFETLISRSESKEWLIDDYKIAYAPSISSLREIIKHEKERKIRPQKDILAFGDPFFGPGEEDIRPEDSLKILSAAESLHFFRLKYSGEEIDKLAALFKKAKTNVFKRQDATEEQLKKLNLADYRILHFATHCLIDDKKPARSSIIFSVGNPSAEDEILQMREIFNLKLNSDLVTLSACETGRGQFIRGEGIEGLSRAFFYAGASSVIISLWPVHDQATSQFMERTYSHLRSSNSIMNSLQKTKKEMIASDVLTHPYYWAGFIATGYSDKIIYPSANIKLILIICLFFVAGGAASLIVFRKKFKPHS